MRLGLCLGLLGAILAIGTPFAGARSECAYPDALLRSGEAGEAKKAYIEALKAMPASECAAEGLEQASDPSVWDDLETLSSDAVTALGALVLGAAAIGAILLLLVVVLARLPWFKSHWPIAVIRRPSVGVEPLDDSGLKDKKLGIGIAALMRERVEPGSEGSALKVISGTTTAEETWIKRVSEVGDQGKIIAALIGLLVSLLPRQYVKVTGVLQPAAEPTGMGIGLELYRKRGSRGSVTFWAWEFQLPTGEEIANARRLAVPAAAWVSHKVTEETEGQTMGSTDPTSWAFFKAAVERQGEGDSESAVKLYLDALAYDPRNYGALANLGGLEAAEGQYERGIARLEKALEVLEDVSRTSSNPDWYRVKYSLVTERVNWAHADRERKTTQLATATAEARSLLTAVDRWLRRPASWGLRKIRDDAGRALDWFLRTHLRPGLLVLLAGIELAKHPSRVAEPDPSAEPEDLADLEAEIRDGEEVDPRRLVRAVEASRVAPSPGIAYNLACFHAQAGDPPRALENLRKTVEGTPLSAWPRLRAEIESDPALEPVKGMVPDLFQGPSKPGGEQSVGGLLALFLRQALD